MAKEKKHICFVVPYCYPIFNPAVKTMYGGWEVRVSQIAKGLARDPQNIVSILVADHGQPHIEEIDNVRLISWIGKRFWGIPDPNPQTVIVERTPPDQHQPASATAQNESSLPGAKEIQPVNNPGNHFLKVPARPKSLYKKLFPWRLRVILSGLLRGGYYGLKQFLMASKPALKNLLIAIKAFFKESGHAVKNSYRVFRDFSKGHLVIAKTAVGNIYEEPVYEDAVKIFKEIDADIFIVPGNTRISAEASIFCRKYGRLFVMLSGSDMDFDPIYQRQPYQLDIYGDPYYIKLFVIKTAHAHIVQNTFQEANAKYFGASPIIIKNPIGLVPEFPKTGTQGVILWVGNTDERVKRPSLVLKYARLLPQYQFIMIATPAIQADYDRLVELSRDIPNLSITSMIPYSEIEKYFANARLFISTSKFEGFPNTFLQAGKYGVPVVSLNVNPNEMFSKHKCGVFCNDDEKVFLDSINKLMTRNEIYDEFSRNILKYVQENHDREKIILQYQTLIDQLLNRNWKRFLHFRKHIPAKEMTNSIHPTP